MTIEPDRPDGLHHRYSRRWRPADARARTFAPATTRHADGVDLLELSDVPRLVLLGEPGAGKTWELERLSEKLRERGERVERVEGRDLARNADPGTPSPAGSLERAAGPGSPGHILLDGIDETGLDGDRTAVFLAAFLDRIQEGAPPHRPPSIAIACRTASWSSDLDAVLETRWASDSVRKLALERSRPLLTALERFLRDKLALISQKSTLAVAIR